MTKQVQCFLDIHHAQLTYDFYKRHPEIYTVGEIAEHPLGDEIVYELLVDYHPPVSRVESFSTKLHRLCMQYEDNPDIDYLLKIAYAVSENIIDYLDNGEYPSFEQLDTIYDVVKKESV